MQIFSFLISKYQAIQRRRGLFLLEMNFCLRKTNRLPAGSGRASRGWVFQHHGEAPHPGQPLGWLRARDAGHMLPSQLSELWEGLFSVPLSDLCKWKKSIWWSPECRAARGCVHGELPCEVQQHSPLWVKLLGTGTEHLSRQNSSVFTGGQDPLAFGFNLVIYAIHRKLWLMNRILLSGLLLWFETSDKMSYLFLLQTFYQGENSDLPRKCLEIFKNGEDIFYLFNLQCFVTRCILFSYICPTFHICVKHYFIL